MFLPPAAAWKVDSARWQRRALLALGLLGAFLSVVFAFSQRWGFPSLFLLLVSGAMTAAALALCQPASGHLRWDGERWHWIGEQEQAVTGLHCVIDLQRFLLLRLDCDSGSGAWLWLHSPSMNARWLALRRAIVAYSGTHPPQSGSLPE